MIRTEIYSAFRDRFLAVTRNISKGMKIFRFR